MSNTRFFPVHIQTLVLFLLLFISLNVTDGFPAMEYYVHPGEEAVEYQSVEATMQNLERPPEYKPFGVCKNCTCCAAGKPKVCLSVPCCFGIKCNLPGKPFGTCAFFPRACNCTGCS